MPRLKERSLSFMFCDQHPVCIYGEKYELSSTSKILHVVLYDNMVLGEHLKLRGQKNRVLRKIA